MLQPPLSSARAKKAAVMRGPSIVPPPLSETPPRDLAGEVLIKLGDKISTDIIMPAGVLLKHRSNVPEYARYVFNPCNEPGKPSFAERALKAKAEGRHGIIVAGESYGQGSSREHAALCPMYLGVRAVLARSIERIHFANLVNFAIVPILFADAGDYGRISAGDLLEIPGLMTAVENGEKTVIIKDKTQGFAVTGKIDFTGRQRKILAAGGLLPWVKGANANR
jgi:aconitate hydratase